MELVKNKCYNLLRKGKGVELVFLLSVDFHRTNDGKNLLCLSYSEVYGALQALVYFDNIDYIYEVPMTNDIKERLIEKFGENRAERLGIVLESQQ